MTTEPALAIIIPVFRHSVLMTDAIQSALSQETPFPLHVVIVNDGCPHPETDIIGRAHARAHPDRVTYLKKVNGGLSSARNHGIAHVLATMPSVRALYMLDADNTLRPQSMARAMAALDADPEAGWIYPDIDMVGLASGHDYSGPYSVLLHTAMNTCEAGSLVRRAVFEAGVMFDTTFKAGFEDWDFFLTAVEAGFRGASIDGFGFLYRKRPESMLADSERERGPILSRLRTKHRALFAPRALLQLEQAEAPRYAIVLSDRDEVWLTTDPAAPPQVLDRDTFALRLWQARSAPGRFVLPPFTLFADADRLAAAQATGMLPGLLWQMELMLDQSDVVGLSFAAARGDRMGLGIRAEGLDSPDAAGMILIATELLTASAADPVGHWMGSLLTPLPHPHFALLQARVPDPSGPLSEGGAGGALLALVQALRASRWAKGALAFRDWREPDLIRRSASHLILRQRLGGQPSLPMLRGEGRHLGLVLTIIEFGGVEKVALNMARAFKARGWTVHLFILGTRDAAVTEEWRETIASVTFTADADFAPWGGGSRSYFGNEIPRWAAEGNHARLIALLHWLDAVIDLHSGATVAVMSQLKRLGVVTVTSLHLADLTPHGRPSGNPFLSLAYEHAFDLFAPCSLALGDWLHGIGVPEDKIVPVPNAPSFPLPVAPPRAASERLRVLYLGRLDPQKGLERLAEVITRSKGLEIDWRIVGRAVLTHGAPPLPDAIARLAEPPLTTPAQLAEAFSQADVLLLLSDYEGLPLTILEAMRQGVVPIATDVGAVGEVVTEETGVLLPLSSAVEGASQALASLASDRARLAALSRGAMAAMADRDWMGATAPLAQAIDAVAATRGVTADLDVSPAGPALPIFAAAQGAEILDLTPPGWHQLRKFGLPEPFGMRRYEPYWDFLQFGSPEGADVTALLSTAPVQGRDGSSLHGVTLKPEGSRQPWFVYELVLTDQPFDQIALLEWRLRYVLGQPIDLYAQFMLDGGGTYLTFDHGHLRAEDMGTTQTLTLALNRLDPAVRAGLTRIRLVLSTDGRPLSLDIMDFSIVGKR